MSGKHTVVTKKTSLRPCYNEEIVFNERLCLQCDNVYLNELEATVNTDLGNIGLELEVYNVTKDEQTELVIFYLFEFIGSLCEICVRSDKMVGN